MNRVLPSEVGVDGLCGSITETIGDDCPLRPARAIIAVEDLHSHRRDPPLPDVWIWVC